MRLLGLNGTERTITSVHSEEKVIPVFNFEVAGINNYFAGEDPVLVHNQNNVQNSSYNAAINDALSWLENQGVDVKSLTEKNISDLTNAPYGMQTPGGRSGFRIEFGRINSAGDVAPHINVWNHKIKGPHFLFDGNENTVKSVLRQLFSCGK
jgi:hypothetical protein